MTAIVLSLITHLNNPTPSPMAIMCCSVPKPGVYGACTPLLTSGFCESGKVPHQCSDTEVCNDDGSACWLECKPLNGGFS